MKKRNIFIIFILLAIFCFFAWSQETAAYSWADSVTTFQKTAGTAGYTNAEIQYSIILKITEILLTFIGAAFVGLFIFGGITWLTAAGSEEKVTKAKKTLTWATIGLFFIVGSVVVTTMVMDALNPAGPVENAATGGDTSADDCPTYAASIPLPQGPGTGQCFTADVCKAADGKKADPTFDQCPIPQICCITNFTCEVNCGAFDNKTDCENFMLDLCNVTQPRANNLGHCEWHWNIGDNCEFVQTAF